MMNVLLLVGRIELRTQRIVIWDLGGQEDLQTLWDKVLLHVCNINTFVKM